MPTIIKRELVCAAVQVYGKHGRWVNWAFSVSKLEDLGEFLSCLDFYHDLLVGPLQKPKVWANILKIRDCDSPIVLKMWLDLIDTGCL